MLVIPKLVVDGYLVRRAPNEDVLSMSRDASFVFARLPSGYCELPHSSQILLFNRQTTLVAFIVRSKDEEPGSDEEYQSVIVTNAVKFSFKEASVSQSPRSAVAHSCVTTGPFDRQVDQGWAGVRTSPQ